LRPLDDMPVETRSRIRRLIDVHDAVRVCLRSHLDGSSDEQVIESREKLNLAYDRFLARFGPINARVNQNAFDGDPDLPLLLSLEHYDEETNVAVKTSIFRERTIHQKQPIESVETAKEALLVSLNEKGRLDLEHMAGLLDQSVEEFLPDLKGMIFLNPQSKQWETEDQYLPYSRQHAPFAGGSAAIHRATRESAAGFGRATRHFRRQVPHRTGWADTRQPRRRR
jgi:N12 class adenine-specific DNA methylase